MILKMEIPSPGESISEVEIAQWLFLMVNILINQIIAEIDSDKATLELPAETIWSYYSKSWRRRCCRGWSSCCHIDTEAEGISKEKPTVSDISEKNLEVKPNTDSDDSKSEILGPAARKITEEKDWHI